jgi:hypothetical protein
MAGMGVYELWNSEEIAASGVSTSAAIDIGKANALAVHLTAITGTAPDVSFTYTLSNSSAGDFTAGEETIKANASAACVNDFSPEAARFIKIVATNNNGANAVTISGQLAIQEL